VGFAGNLLLAVKALPQHHSFTPGSLPRVATSVSPRSERLGVPGGLPRDGVAIPRGPGVWRGAPQPELLVCLPKAARLSGGVFRLVLTALVY